MIKELKIFLTAVMFFTRIPVSGKLEYSDRMLNQSLRYFPFIGVIVGSFGAGIILISLQVFNIYVSVLLGMIATIFITGAFHEDGFADFCDGYGGGYTKDRILSIMKDSRLGTYGTIGLILILALKFFLITGYNRSQIPYILICAHTMSRFVPVILISTTQYVRDDQTSKSKPLGTKTSIITILVGLVFGLGSFWFMEPIHAVFIIGILLVVFLFFRAYIIRKTGGYTGDVLGALQQISEIVIYFSYLIVLKIL